MKQRRLGRNKWSRKKRSSWPGDLCVRVDVGCRCEAASISPDGGPTNRVVGRDEDLSRRYFFFAQTGSNRIQTG